MEYWNDGKLEFCGIELLLRAINTLLHRSIIPPCHYSSPPFLNYYDFRCRVNAEFAVFRSRNRGEKWERSDLGLPNKNVYLNVYCRAMSADTCDPCGVYLGTSTSQIFYSRDDGDSWELLAN
ncbi:MAG: WD40/YVTN/BNR-like repeat-containing protein [bacterium]